MSNAQREHSVGIYTEKDAKLSIKRRKTLLAFGNTAYSILQFCNPARANLLGRLFFPATRVVVPFEAGRKEAVAVINYHASRDASFYFYLNLEFSESQPGSRDNVRKVAGSGATTNGIQVDNGIPISLQLLITKLSGANEEKPIFHQTIEEERLEGWADKYFSKIISKVFLTRGDYKVKVKSLNDTPELTGIPTYFDIHIPGNLK